MYLSFLVILSTTEHNLQSQQACTENRFTHSFVVGVNLQSNNEVESELVPEDLVQEHAVLYATLSGAN